MQPWAQWVLVVCAVALTVVVVPVAVAVWRAARRAETVLEIVEQELRPLIGQAHALGDDLRTLTREASLEIKRLGEATERLNAVGEGVGRVVGALAGLTRAGQMIGLATGLKRGIDVFVQRFWKEEEHHG